jgi:hypothetical protein
MPLPINPLPQPPWPWIDPKTGQPTQAFLQYMTKLNRGLIGPLPGSFATDSAAATGGVPIGGLYFNNTSAGVNVVQIRVT